MTAPVRRSARPAPMARVSAPMAGPVLAGGKLIPAGRGGIGRPGPHSAAVTRSMQGWTRVCGTLPAFDEGGLSRTAPRQAGVRGRDRMPLCAGDVKPATERAPGPSPRRTAGVWPPEGRAAETGVSAADRMNSAIRPSVAVR